MRAVTVPDVVFAKATFHLLAVLEPAGEVRELREVGVGAQAAGRRDGVVDATTARQSVDSGIHDGTDHVHQQARRRRQVERRVGGGSGEFWAAAVAAEADDA